MSIATKPAPPVEAFSIAETRAIVNDLFRPKAWVYWTDFLLSIVLGMVCFGAIRRGYLVQVAADALGTTSPAFFYSAYGALFVASCLLFYRATLFTHELIHLRDHEVRGFRTAWNLMCGIPFLMPSFTYHTHVHHHMRKHYATPDDGEYLTLASGPPRHIWAYLGMSFIVPVVAVVRFMVLQPLTWISPRIRDWAHQRLSSMVIDPKFIRPLPTDRQRVLWRLQELGCFAFCTTIAVLLFAGVLPWMWLVHAYSTAAVIILLNAVRTLGAHRYRCSGEEVTFTEQLIDSVNYPTHRFWHGLLMPVGLRFHGLHHLFPSLPYHELERAHHRLMEQLPADHPYRQTVSPSLWASVRQLFRDAGESKRRLMEGRQAPRRSVDAAA